MRVTPEVTSHRWVIEKFHLVSSWEVVKQGLVFSGLSKGSFAVEINNRLGNIITPQYCGIFLLPLY